MAVALAGCASIAAGQKTPVQGKSASDHSSTTAAQTSSSTSPTVSKRRHTTTTGPPPPTVTTTTLASPGPGLVVGRVSILGDSVTVDAAPDLERDIKGARVDAAVSEQWYQGVAEADSLRSEGQLGAVVVIALGTNGPIDSADIAEMVRALAGASRIVLVTNHVPTRYWQNPNNEVIQESASRYKNVVVANWAALAAQHPEWFGSDEVHMVIGGPGAQAMAALIASKV